MDTYAVTFDISDARVHNYGANGLYLEATNLFESHIGAIKGGV